jgi:type II secretory pathway component GspD/PulD (secretin)
MLLVTGHPLDLIKASEILKIVDSKERFIIKVISPASEAQNLPSNEDIATEVGDISIGTFLEPPPSGVESKAIIDIHQDSVITVAPLDKIDGIIAVIERLTKTAAKPAGKIVEQTGKVTAGPEIEQPIPQIIQTIKTPDEPEFEVVVETKVQRRDVFDKHAERAEKSEPEPDELFDKLLDSLAEAEATMAELERTKAEPNEAEVPLGLARKIEIKPDVAVSLPEPPEKRKPLVPFEPVAETEEVIQQPKQLQAVEFTAVIEKMVAEEVAKRLAIEALKEPTEPNEEVPEPQVDDSRLYQPKVVVDGNDMLDLDLPDKLEIIDLLGLVGEYFNLDYIYDPAKVKGAVTLRLRGPIKGKDLYPLLESVLKFQGFVMTRKDNLVRIVPETDVLNIDPVIIDEEKVGIEVGDVIVTRIFKLKHIDAGSANNLLDGMKLGVNINTSASDVGVLIVTGYAHRMSRIEKLLDMVDKPGKPKEFRFRKLEYTMATTLAPKVKTLAEQLGTISISITEAPPAPRAQKQPPRGGRQTTPPKAAPRRGRATAKQPAPTEETVYLDADERTNRILMIGLKEQMDVVDELIDALDVEQADVRTIRLYDIQNVGAEEVMEKLNELGIISSFSGTSRRRSSRISGGRAGAAGSTAAAQRQQAAAQKERRGTIESTNSLLANATDEQHARIAMIIGYVDNETLERAIPYKIYTFENQSPVDVAEVLNKLIQETITDKAGKIEKVVQKQDEDIVIVPDENTFSLIVYASKKNQEWLGNLIKTLDKRRPQVLIDVTLVEVSRTDLFDLDLQLASKFPKMEAGGTMDVVGSVITPFLSSTSIEAFSSPVAGTAQGFYSDSHVQALLTAMQTKSYGRVLAKPKILVNDGQPGTIKTTDTTNVKLQTTSIVPDAGSSTAVSYEQYDAGITLTITPNISEGDLLLLEVELDRSDFLDPPEAGAPPDTTASNINTVVTVPNARTIILGGLLKLNQTKGGTKVPILGDIPLVGGLFRSASNSARDSKLYIFVKANILRPDEMLTGLPELEEISARNAAAFEKFEEGFQEFQDWPGIKSEPMDPLHVLEAE